MLGNTGSVWFIPQAKGEESAEALQDLVAGSMESLVDYELLPTMEMVVAYRLHSIRQPVVYGPYPEGQNKLHCENLTAVLEVIHLLGDNLRFPGFPMVCACPCAHGTRSFLEMASDRYRGSHAINCHSSVADKLATISRSKVSLLRCGTW